MKELIVTIDGPAGSGKSTMARRLAEALGYVYIDTGAMYRAAGLKADREGIDLDEAPDVEELARGLDIRQASAAGGTRTFLDGEDVSKEIRTPEASRLASVVSTKKAVRRKLVELQRGMGRKGGVVMEGRDIGSVVFPAAEAKFYLDASPEVRARRRFEELRERGLDVTYEDTLREMKERDRRDATRPDSPLRVPEGADVVDTTRLDPEEVFEALLDKVTRIRRELKKTSLRGSGPRNPAPVIPS